MVARGVDAVVAEANLSFRAPARYDDELALAAEVTRLGRTAITTRDRCAAWPRAAGGRPPAPRVRGDGHMAQDRRARLGAQRA